MNPSIDTLHVFRLNGEAFQAAEGLCTWDSLSPYVRVVLDAHRPIKDLHGFTHDLDSVTLGEATPERVRAYLHSRHEAGCDLVAWLARWVLADRVPRLTLARMPETQRDMLGDLVSDLTREARHCAGCGKRRSDYVLLLGPRWGFSLALCRGVGQRYAGECLRRAVKAILHRCPGCGEVIDWEHTSERLCPSCRQLLGLGRQAQTGRVPIRANILSDGWEPLGHLMAMDGAHNLAGRLGQAIRSMLIPPDLDVLQGEVPLEPWRQTALEDLQSGLKLLARALRARIERERRAGFQQGRSFLLGLAQGSFEAHALNAVEPAAEEDEPQ